MANVDSSVPRYKYESVEILDIYDADTLTVVIDLGFKVFHRAKLRLARINAWEVRGEAEKERGIAARDYLISRIREGANRGKKVWIETFQDAQEKFGRYLAELYIGDENMNDELVNKKHARYADYS